MMRWRPPMTSSAASTRDGPWVNAYFSTSVQPTQGSTPLALRVVATWQVRYLSWLSAIIRMSTNALAILRSDVRVIDHQLAFKAQQLTQQRVIQETQASAPGFASSAVKLSNALITQEGDEILVAAMGTQGTGWSGEGFADDELSTTRDWLKQKIADDCRRHQGSANEHYCETRIGAARRISRDMNRPTATAYDITHDHGPDKRH